MLHTWKLYNIVKQLYLSNKFFKEILKNSQFGLYCLNLRDIIESGTQTQTTLTLIADVQSFKIN